LGPHRDDDRVARFHPGAVHRVARDGHRLVQRRDVERDLGRNDSEAVAEFGVRDQEKVRQRARRPAVANYSVAARHRVDHDVVAAPDALDAVADVDDLTGRLVAERCRALARRDAAFSLTSGAI